MPAPFGLLLQTLINSHENVIAGFENPPEAGLPAQVPRAVVVLPEIGDRDKYRRTHVRDHRPHQAIPEELDLPILITAIRYCIMHPR